MQDNPAMRAHESSPESSKTGLSVGIDAPAANAKPPPVWMSPMLAGIQREKIRLREELGRLKGALPLLMKQRNGGKWTTEERQQLRTLLRSASAVSPYLLIWVLPGSVLLLPLLAWYLDARRKRREKRAR